MSEQTKPTYEELTAQVQTVLASRAAVIRQREQAMNGIIDVQVELEAALQHIQRLNAEIEALKKLVPEKQEEEAADVGTAAV